MEEKGVLISCGPEMLSPAHIRELDTIFNLGMFQCSMGESHIINTIKNHKTTGYILGGLEHFTREAAEIVSGTLEWIAFLGEQEDTFIDVKACIENGIRVFKTGGGARSVAQKTFEQIVNPDRIRNWYARQFKWVSGSDAQMKSLIRDQKIAIIGAGQIGQLVMKKLKRLMRGGKGEVFYAAGRGEKPGLAKQGFRYEPDLVKAFDADVVSLHLTYVPGVTENIITAEHLGRIRPYGIFINNARAELTHPNALRVWLNAKPSETLSVFDVFWKEGNDFQNLRNADHPFDENHVYWELLRLPNFEYTQHSAALYRPKWTQQEYWEGLQRIIAENNLA